MKQLELQRRYESEKIDLTLPADETGVGNLHPITLVRNQLIDIFAGMGFEVYEGASGKRYAGYFLSVTRVLASYTDLRRSDSCYGEQEAADQDFITRKSIPF